MSMPAGVVPDNRFGTSWKSYVWMHNLLVNVGTENWEVVKALRDEVMNHIAATEDENKALQARVDGYHPINKSPSLGDWVLVRFVPGFIQPYKAVQYLEDKFGNRRFGPHMDRQIDRWWPAGEVR